jgi:hypothetical protein
MFRNSGKHTSIHLDPHKARKYNMSDFNICIPENLSFADYMAIVQTARVLADGYDKKVSTSVRPKTFAVVEVF